MPTGGRRSDGGRLTVVAGATAGGGSSVVLHCDFEVCFGVFLVMSGGDRVRGDVVMFDAENKRCQAKFATPHVKRAGQRREVERCGSLALKIHVAEKALRAEIEAVLSLLILYGCGNRMSS